MADRNLLTRAARWLRDAPENMGLIRGETKPGFFDQYPRFYSTSIVNAAPERLNERYRALIGSNEQLIKGKRILDLAAHDGRWSFAALKAGAHHVTSIEGRSHLVESAIATAHEYGIDSERYRFITGDVFDQLDLVATNSIDTVFCFGFLYHTPHHMLLLSKIAQLNPKHLILDTAIIPSTTDCVIRLVKEKTAGDGNSIAGQPGNPLHSVVGRPSRSAVEMMLTSFGWSFSYYDWQRAGITASRYLRDYRGGWRISLVAIRSERDALEPAPVPPLNGRHGKSNA